jgi:Mg/Co/Ni transporter MgtE
VTPSTGCCIVARSRAAGTLYLRGVPRRVWLEEGVAALVAIVFAVALCAALLTWWAGLP